MPIPVPPLPPEQFDACVAQAEQKYQVPACILHAVHQVESSGDLAPGLVRSNSNGTSDYGVTQINTVWVKYFGRNFQISGNDFANNACLAVNGAAYIIRYEINASGNFWDGVGNYHSRSPGEHERYIAKVAAQAQRFGCQIR
jgi:hypothetical protein